MIFKKHGDYLFVRLHNGDDLMTALEEIMTKERIKTALFQSAVGMLEEVETGYFNGTQYETIQHPGCYEMLSMQGNITLQSDGYVIHIHVILGKEDGSTFGGHLMTGKVKNTMEMVFLVSDFGIRRVPEANNLKGWSF